MYGDQATRCRVFKMAGKQYVLGVDPGLKRHTAALMRLHLPVNDQTDYWSRLERIYAIAELTLLPTDRHIFDASVGSNVYIRCGQVRAVIIEWPEFQGPWRNFKPIHKRARALLGLFELCGFDHIYKPPTRVIWADLMGKAHATNADKLAYLRETGLSTGRGTMFTHGQHDKVDAFLTADWYNQCIISNDQDRLNDWREPS